jgi:hypothetical protein
MNWDEAVTLANMAGYELELGPYRVYSSPTSTVRGPFSTRYSVTLLANGQRVSVSDVQSSKDCANVALQLIEQANRDKAGVLTFNAKNRYKI